MRNIDWDSTFIQELERDGGFASDGVLSQSHLGKKWNSMTIKTIEGGSLCPLFYVPFLKKSFEKKPKCISYSAR